MDKIGVGLDLQLAVGLDLQLAVGLDFGCDGFVMGLSGCDVFNLGIKGREWESVSID